MKEVGGDTPVTNKPPITTSSDINTSPESKLQVSTFPTELVNPQITDPQTTYSQSSTGSTFQVPPDVQNTFQRLEINNYCLYELSPNKKTIYFQSCGKTSYWEAVCAAIDDSQSGFALYRLENDNILSIMNLHHECETKDSYERWNPEAMCAIGDDENLLISFQQTWLDTIGKAIEQQKLPIGPVIPVGPVRTDKDLATIEFQYVAPESTGQF